MELYFKTYGDGYPLIILHGLFGSSDNWQTLSRAFSSCYRVFSLDLRNHGNSLHADAMDYSTLAGDVREFMQRQRLASAYVLGHSMGGKTAMQLALSHPELVDKLVVVDIAPKRYPSHHDEILDALLALDPTSYSRRKDADAALATRLKDPALRAFLLKNLTRDDSGFFRWRINLDAIARHYDQLLQAVVADRPFQKPTLFIRSELSGYIKAADEPRIRELFPYSKTVTLPGVGHWVHVEARRRFARFVLAFLGSM